MIKRLPWFACYPDKWLAVLAELKPDVGYVYLIVCFRIYEKEGPVPDSYQALARRTGYRPTHIKKIIDHLCELGKLRRTPDGLMNAFAEHELNNRAKRRSEKIESQTVNKTSEKTLMNQRSDPTHIHRQEHKKERKRESLPALWHPGDHTIRYAVSKGFAGDKLQPIIRNFIHWHRARDVCLANFDDEFMRWIDREIEFEKQRKHTGGDNGQRGSRALQDDKLSVGKAAQRLAEQVGEGGQFPPRPRLVPDESSADRRLLPSR